MNKLDADLVVFDISDAYYGHEINLTAKLGNIDYDVEGPVIFYVDGVKVGSATVSNGKAIYSYYPTKTGKFVLKAVMGQIFIVLIVMLLILQLIN